MPATTNSDKFLNTVPRWSGQVGAAGVSSTTATVIPLQSTTGLVNGRAYFFTFNRLTGTTKNPVSSTEGLVGVVNTSTNEITTTLANRGLEGAAAAWAAGTLVEILHSAGYMNRLIEGLEVSLNQDGTLKPLTLNHESTIATPDSGKIRVYAKNDNKIYKKDSAGTETEVGAAENNAENLLKNGNFIDNSTNGYGSTPDNWTNSSANPIGGGFPTITKQELIDALGITTDQIEALYPLNGSWADLSDNGYTLVAGGTPDDDNDGFLAQCKSFVGSTEYAKVSAPNAAIVGNQTFFCAIKLTAYSSTNSFYVRVGDSTNYVGFRSAQASGDNTAFGLTFELSSISGGSNQFNIKDYHSKWLFIVGIYDQTNGKIRIWINGAKVDEATVTGTHAITGDTTLRINSNASNTGDTCKMQCIGVLSTALTDDQARLLWQLTTQKGVKLRRSGSDGHISQTLSPDLVSLLRGKTVTVAGEFYQSSANQANISITEGTETESADSSTTGSWVETSATKTISATATSIVIKAKVSGSDGCVWFKKLRLYEGDTVIEYKPSEFDKRSFPYAIELYNPDTVPTHKVNKGVINLNPVPNNGFTSGANTCYWGFSYGATVYFQALTTGTYMARTTHFILPEDCDTTKPIEFKMRGEASGSLTVTPTVICGYLRAHGGGISALTGFNNSDLATLAMNTSQNDYNIATIPANSFRPGDAIMFGVGLKSSGTVAMRNLRMEYSKK